MIAYTLVFRYAEAPPVEVRFSPNCTPHVTNHNLEAVDDGTVSRLVDALLERPST